MKYVGFLRASVFCLQEARVVHFAADWENLVFSTNWIENTENAHHGAQSEHDLQNRRKIQMSPIM
jgi:hypothetical protein